MATKRVRFWCWLDTPVLIKLRAGQTLRHSRGGQTDEGWSREDNIWSFDGQTVTHEWVDDSVDCDGRLTRSGKQECPVRALWAGKYNAEDGVTYPDWRAVSQRQRDYSAEAMGY